jgi:hypothetical protein
MKRSILTLAVLLAGAGSAAAENWTVTTAGYGPVRIGDTVQQAQKALGKKLVSDGPVDTPDCYYLRPEPAVEGLWFMINNGRVVRVEVNAPGITTRSGLGVGAAEAEVKATLGKGVAVTPHKYVAPDGNYLTLWSADKKRAVRFETLQGKVTSFYAGRKPEVEFVEGCS